MVCVSRISARANVSLFLWGSAITMSLLIFLRYQRLVYASAPKSTTIPANNPFSFDGCVVCWNCDETRCATDVASTATLTTAPCSWRRFFPPACPSSSGWRCFPLCSSGLRTGSCCAISARSVYAWATRAQREWSNCCCSQYSCTPAWAVGRSPCLLGNPVHCGNLV